MRFIQVQYADIVAKRPKYKLEADLTEFVRMNVQAVKVPWEGHYKSANVAANVMEVAIRRHSMPIRVMRRDNEVYLIRTDM